MNFFGTDGIRGEYGTTLTTQTAYRLGKSLALIGGDCPIVVIGSDTRTSSPKLFSALAAGVNGGGGNVINLGVLPTNAVGHFTRKFGGDFGVMITASHNPPCDNGLKVFDTYGVKVCAAKQCVISDAMNAVTAEYSSKKVFEPVFYDIENIYVDDVLSAVGVSDCKGLSVALDLCYGATFKVAPAAFEKVGAKVTAFCAKADGKRVNVDCGATNPQFLQSRMQGNALGFSFDGDGDRLAVFEGQTLLSGSKVFYALAKYLHQSGRLKRNVAVGTVLTNGGVERALKGLGIKLLRSDVGDRNVFDVMVNCGAVFGGEDSGHYLLTELATSSDALINALILTKIYSEKGSLIAYTEECEEIPHIAQSLPVTEENACLIGEKQLAATTARISALYPECRTVIRKSGTENKLRIYLEGENVSDAQKEILATFCR